MHAYIRIYVGIIHTYIHRNARYGTLTRGVFRSFPSPGEGVVKDNTGVVPGDPSGPIKPFTLWPH
jgi:hypothetical protein